MSKICFPSTYHPSMGHLWVHGVLEVKSIRLQQLGSPLSGIDCLKFLAPYEKVHLGSGISQFGSTNMCLNVPQISRVK
jgi:hypothetical protein